MKLNYFDFEFFKRVDTLDSPLKNKLMNSFKTEMVSFLMANPEHFDEALKLALGDDQPLSWRAAWLLCCCMEKNDPRIRKSIKSIISVLPEKTDGHQRELIKILLKIEMPEEYEGMLFDHCLTLWETPGLSPSVRITAFKFILKMAKRYPELKNEISFLTGERYLETLSPGIRRSIQKMIKELERN